MIISFWQPWLQGTIWYLKQTSSLHYTVPSELTTTKFHRKCTNFDTEIGRYYNMFPMFQHSGKPFLLRFCRNILSLPNLKRGRKMRRITVFCCFFFCFFFFCRLVIRGNRCVTSFTKRNTTETESKKQGKKKMIQKQRKKKRALKTIGKTSELQRR